MQEQINEKIMNSIVANMKYDENNLNHKLINRIVKLLQIDNFAGLQPLDRTVGSVYNMTMDNAILNVIANAVSTHNIEFASRLDSNSMNKSVDVYGTYMEEQYVNFMSTEIVYEMHKKLLDTMYVNSQSVNYRIESNDEPAIILSKLISASMKVSYNSKRGSANKWVLPKSLYHRIGSVLKPALTHVHDQQSSTDLLYCGDFGGISVFTSIYSDVAMVHYKGANQIDSNIIYNIFNLITRVEYGNYIKSSIRMAVSVFSDKNTISLQIRD